MIRTRSTPVAVLALGLLVGSGPPSDEAAVAERLSRVRAIHGAAGPRAVAGYRIGGRALRDLNLPRQSFSLFVTHRCPRQIQYSCVADGLQAATGASPGKLNLVIEKASLDGLRTWIGDNKTGRSLTFTLRTEFIRSITELADDRPEAEGKRVTDLLGNEIFEFVESR